MKDGFLIPAGPGESELTEKRSRFLGHLVPVESEEAARAFVAQMKKQYHDARHNCWCYRLREGPERYSDDGEPQGSAGMPMLEVFRREEVYNFCCVVTRYFGGVLLGTGGLSRAYSGAAKESLTQAGTLLIGSFTELSFDCPYNLGERIRNRLEAAGAELVDLNYGAEIRMKIRIAEDAAEEICTWLADASGGKIRCEMCRVQSAKRKE